MARSGTTGSYKGISQFGEQIMEHTGSVVEKPGNYPQFRFEGNCSCGWHTKQASEQQAVSSLQNHGASIEMPKPVVPAPAPKP